MPPIARLVLLSCAVLLPLLPARLRAQSEASMYYRAAKAHAVDSIARLPALSIPRMPGVPPSDGDAERLGDAPTVAQVVLDSGVVNRVMEFVKSPFDRKPPTLQELDSAYRLVAAARVNPLEGKEGDESGASAFSLGGSLLPVAGLPGEADLVLGLADFMVERAKDELAFAFVTDLQKQTRGNLLIRNAMPGSFGVLQRIDALSFQALMPALRSSVAEDLASLPTRVGEPKILDLLRLRGRERTTVQASAIVYARVREIRGGMEPVTALANLRDLGPASLEKETVRAPLVLVGLVASEFSLYQDSLHSLLRVPEKRRIFAGLLLRELEARIDTAQHARMKAMLQAHLNDLELLAGELRSLHRALSDARFQVAQDSTRRAAVLAVSETALGILRSSQRFVHPDWRADLPTLDFIQDASELHEALRDKNYSAVVAWVAEVGHRHFAERPSSAHTLRYLSFAGTLAGARSAAEVTTALRTVSAPVGTYRLKRGQENSDARPFVLSLTGFLGVGAGYEHASGTGSGAAHFGPVLPIGLEASWARKTGSFAIFVPILDLGTVASVRLGGKDEEPDAELGFAQVLAPGVFLVRGITSDKPISVGVGLQTVRNLREEEGGGGLLDVWRLTVFGGVDVTLLKL